MIDRIKGEASVEFEEMFPAKQPSRVVVKTKDVITSYSIHYTKLYECEIAGKHGRRVAVKSKSMTGEEIDLTHALERAGFEAIETDLGESYNFV